MSQAPELRRGLGLWSAAALNMTDMIGAGPFITLPLMVGAMGGPQAMLGWILGAVFALCDGMTWAELGAASPGSGGSYLYLKQCFGPDRWGGVFGFLFLWQLSFSAPLSIASGCVGLARYASYLWPRLQTPWLQCDWLVSLPGLGATRVGLSARGETLAAMLAVALAAALAHRRIEAAGRIARWMWLGVIATIGWVVFAGFTHFDAHRAFTPPAGAFTLGEPFFLGLGSAMLVAAYDYWGYYNICFMGGEVRDPERNIPRAVALSIVAVAGLYLAMNVSVLGVMDWRELAAAAQGDARFYTASLMMERLYGRWAGSLASLLVMGVCFASVFSLLMGYSRVPYAAARQGEYFAVFARVDERRRIPHFSLWMLAAGAMLACFVRLSDLIAALVVLRILTQFLLQTAGLLLARRRGLLPRPWRMPLYPLPSLLAMAGFVYVLLMRPNGGRELRWAAIIVAVGLLTYCVRAARLGLWPFGHRRIESPSLED